MGKNILCIEDNPDNMLLVKRVLQFRGYHLLEAANGTEGLATAEAQPVDLILLDINLPDIDGYEVARRLRSSTKLQLAYIPIIAITANALKGDAEKALESGCDVYMSKPINIRELWARVEGYVPAMPEPAPAPVRSPSPASTPIQSSAYSPGRSPSLDGGSSQAGAPSQADSAAPSSSPGLEGGASQPAAPSQTSIHSPSEPSSPGESMTSASVSSQADSPSPRGDPGHADETSQAEDPGQVTW